MYISARSLLHDVSRRFWRVVSQVQRQSADSMRYSRNNLAAIGAVGFFTFPVYYVIWRQFFPQDYENLPLRLIGSAICLPLLLVGRWPDWAERWLPAYFWFAMLYCLPFFFQFMLIQNAQYSHAVDDASTVWQMSNVVALLLLVMLINDGLLLAITFLLGTLAAWGLFWVTNDVIHFEAIREDYLAPMPVYLFIMIGGSIFNHRREMIQQEMLRAVSSVGSNIAHELRTPLLGIKSDARGLERYLPQLIEGYERAREAGLEVRPIRHAHLAGLRQSLERIDSETDYANTIIDMLLINSGGTTVIPSQFERCSALEAVRSALERYPFNSEHERRLVHIVEDRDFAFDGSRVLLMHVIFNLLKNALYHIARAGRGEIFIWLEPSREEGANRLLFMDSGTGIPAHELPRIFERFYSSLGAGRGSGIGLSFCKMVMEGFGGSITCESVHGQYTRFILTFPGVEA